MKVEQWGMTYPVDALACSSCNRIQFFMGFPNQPEGYLPLFAS